MTLYDVETKAFVDTRAKNLPEMKVKTNADTLGDMKTDELIDPGRRSSRDGS